MNSELLGQKLDAANVEAVTLTRQISNLVKSGELSQLNGHKLIQHVQELTSTLAFLSAYVRHQQPPTDPKEKLAHDLNNMVKGISSLMPRRPAVPVDMLLSKFLTPAIVPHGEGSLDASHPDLPSYGPDSPLDVDPEMAEHWPEGFYRIHSDDVSPGLLLLQVPVDETTRRPFVLKFHIGMPDVLEELYVPFVRTQEEGHPHVWISTLLMSESVVMVWKTLVYHYLSQKSKT